MTQALPSLHTLVIGSLLLTATSAFASGLAAKTVDADLCEQELDDVYANLGAAYADYSDLSGDRVLESATATTPFDTCADELDAAHGELGAIHDDVHAAAEHDVRYGDVESDKICVQWCSVSTCGVCVRWDGGRSGAGMTEEIAIVTEML